MTKDTSLERYYVLLLKSAKKGNLQKQNFFKNPVIKYKRLQKLCPKNDKIYIFEKPLTIPF